MYLSFKLHNLGQSQKQQRVLVAYVLVTYTSDVIEVFSGHDPLAVLRILHELEAGRRIRGEDIWHI